MILGHPVLLLALYTIQYTYTIEIKCSFSIVVDGNIHYTYNIHILNLFKYTQQFFLNPQNKS